LLNDVPERIRPAVELLRSWDCRLTADSAAAAFFEIWYRRHLRPALLDQALTRLVDNDTRQAALGHILPVEDMAADCRVDLSLLLTPNGRLGPDPESTISSIVISSLQAAIEETQNLLGPNRSRWTWGTLHRAHLRHPQAVLLGSDHESWTSVGPVPRGGSGDTVGCTTYSDDFLQTVGASFRIVVDVGEWDNSVAMNTPGQSGVHTSPHFKNLFASWAEGGSFPLLYSRSKVEQHVSEVIKLTPGITSSPT